MEKVTISKYEDAIKKKMLDIFKEDYLKFIYAENWCQSLEYSMQTSSTIFWLEYWKLMETETAEKIRKFMIDNISLDKEWRKKLIRSTV